MAGVGGDVWSPAATGVLKAGVRAELAGYLGGGGVRRTLEEGVTAGNGNGVADDAGIRQHNEGEEEEEEEGRGKAEEEAANDEVTILESPMKSNDDRDDFEKQLLFDWLYILAATTSPTPTASSAASSQAQVTTSSENGSLSLMVSVMETQVHLGPAEMARLRKAAEEYWKRTSLLFALLA